LLKLHEIYFRKFVSIFILLFIVVGTIVYYWLKDIYITQVEKSLKNDLNLIALIVKKDNDFDNLAIYVKEKLNTRLTIIDKDGNILAESNEDKTKMENHKYRDEIIEASKNEFGKAIRVSKTIGKNLLYIAKKVEINGQILYVRVAKEILKINKVLYSLAFQVGIVLIIFFIVAFYIAYKISLKLQKETKRILKFLLELTKKRKNLYINSNFSQEFFEITKLLSKVARVLAKQDKQKAKYTAKLKSANTQKDDIISAISHEFKNPIAVINGYSQTLLEDQNINETIRAKFLKKIHSNGEKLSLLIDKLRLSIKLDDKKLSLNLTTINLNNLVNSITQDLKQTYKYRNIIIYSDGEILIKADSTLMEVAISNIVENALKYSDDDIKIIINQTSLSVIDSGIGISSYEIDKITKKFYRVSNNTWNNSLGLGLTIVSNILKLHNFKLEIHSSENHGSTFTIVYS